MAAIWSSGVEAPAVTPTLSQPTNQEGSSSSGASTWWVRGHAAAQMSARRVVFDELRPPMTTMASTSSASAAADSWRWRVAMSASMDAARGERLDHRVQRLAGLRRLHDDAHRRLDARRQVARGGDHEHLAPRFARVGYEAFHLGMALLPHHHDAAAAACEIGGGLLRAGDVRARGVDEGQIAFFHRPAHRGGHAVTADDHRAALDVLGAVDRADAARRQFGHHLRIVDERTQRGCALAAGAGLDGHVERALHAVARPGVACLHHSHATS